MITLRPRIAHLLVMLLFLAAHTSHAQGPYTVDKHTVALWSFEDVLGSTITDSTGFHDGIASGTSAETGRFGLARGFRGSGLGDFITVPDDPGLNGFTRLTIEAWIYPTSFDLGNFNAQEGLVEKGDESDPYNLYLLYILRNGDGAVPSFDSFRIGFAAIVNNLGAGTLSSVAHLPNQWYYVAGTYDGIRARVYVNGVLEAEGDPAPGLVLSNNQPLYINNHTFFHGGASSQGRFGGRIDEVRLSDIDRSSTEILQTYTKAPAPLATLYVNNHPLSSHEDTWVRFVGTSTLPTLLGSRTDRLTTASRATWWGLKEAVFNLPNPYRHSLCIGVKPDGTSGPVPLGPLDVCEPGRAWQVGLAAVQVPNFTDLQVIDTVAQLWPGRTLQDVLAEVATQAGYDPTKGIGAQIVSSQGVLQRSWLLRHPAVGLTLVEQNVTAECIDTTHSFCFGTDWKQTAAYAPTLDDSLRSIADLRAIFDLLAP